MLKNIRDMVGKRLRERAAGESGFTLVELLVVMLILGLLAAIAIPSFFNQRDKATDAKAKTYVRTAETAMETYATDNGGSVQTTPAVTAADLVNIEPTLAGASNLTPTVTAAHSYSVAADSDTGNTFTITSTDGVATSSCTTHDQGGCPHDGHWAG